MRTCPDCRAQLVKPVPTNSKTEFIDYKVVLSTLNPGDIAIIKSILDSGGITYFFQGENFTHWGWGIPSRLMVKEDQAEEAKELLKDLKLSLGGVSSQKNSKKSDENSKEK